MVKWWFEAVDLEALVHYCLGSLAEERDVESALGDLVALEGFGLVLFGF